MPGPGKRNMKQERPENAKATLGRLLRYLLDYKWRLALIGLCVIVSALAGVAGTYLIRPFINDYIVPFIGRQNVDLSGFARLILTMALIYGAGVLSAWTYQRLMLTISTKVLLQVRTEMFGHMMELPLSFFDSRTHGEVMSRYTNDTDTLRELLSNTVPQTFSSCLTVISVFVMMVILSPALTLLVVAMLAVMLLVVKKIGGASASYFIKQQRALGGLNGYIEEMISGVKVVKVFCHEDQSKAGFDQRNEELFQAASSANTLANILMPIMGNLSNLHYALTAACGAALAIAGRLDLGSIGSFLQYTRSFSQPITQVSQQMNNILSALAGAERIFKLIDEPVEVDAGHVTLVRVRQDATGRLCECPERTGLWAWKDPQAQDGQGALIPLRGDVRFDKVSFGYTPGKPVLRQVSLYAKPGQKIAFVGATGAGKTTITNLINRFYEIDDGTITYDGIDVRRIRKYDLRRSLSMVLQDTHLFTGTVMENIRYGRLDATDEDCIAAARTANADFFIRHLPAGYQTVLTGDGANLSQGQRQLLSIARAAVNDPPVLILDEATSSIDTRTEAIIERGLDSLMQGRTVFVIAHRLSTVRNANAIIVLDQGQVAERGDHQDLLAQHGLYYQLYTGMFELE